MSVPSLSFLCNKTLNFQLTTSLNASSPPSITSALEILAQIPEIPRNSPSCLNSFYFDSQSVILETKNILDVLAYIDNETLFVSDFDNTLIRPTQTLGSDEWSIYYQNLLQEKGIEKTEAGRQMSTVFNAIHEISDVKLVCPKISRIFSELKKQNCKMLGLTARNAKILNATLREINSVDINFSSNCPFPDNLELEAPLPYVYSQGVIFATIKNRKGDALVNFLNHINFKPKKIIFIDDKLSHVTDVVEATKKEGIKTVGIRYSAADKEALNFNPLIADIQLKYFETKIISDKEAELLLLNGS